MFRDYLTVFHKSVKTAFLHFNLKLPVVLRRLFGLIDWQGYEHERPISLMYVIPSPLDGCGESVLYFCSTAVQILQGG